MVRSLAHSFTFELCSAHLAAGRQLGRQIADAQQRDDRQLGGRPVRVLWRCDERQLGEQPVHAL